MKIRRAQARLEKRQEGQGGGPERKRGGDRVVTAPQVAARGSTADLDQMKPKTADSAQREGEGCAWAIYIAY